MNKLLGDGHLWSLNNFEREYLQLAQQNENIRTILDWLHALRELTSEHCPKLVATGIAYGPYLEHLKTHPGERRRNPNIALLFETKLESIYDAAADIGDEIIVPFFERFGYFPYFLPLTRESLHHPYPEIGETLRKAFKASSIQFFP